MTSTDRYAPHTSSPSADWEPCRRTRNGARCGERLEFATNGMGRVIAECPVCDWGWKPGREYDAFTLRMEQAQAAALPDIDRLYVRDFGETVCRGCGCTFYRKIGARRYCNDECRRHVINRRAREAKKRARARQPGDPRRYPNQAFTVEWREKMRGAA